MTLPALLKKVGLGVPLYVTVDGRVVTESLSEATTPSTSGTVTPRPMLPHKFHGGIETAESPAIPTAWWITDPDRKARDIADMRASFPSAIVHEEGASFSYSLVIDTGRGRFTCSFAPRRGGGIPIIRVLNPSRLGRQEGRHFRQPPHLYNAGNLCVASEKDWNPFECQTGDAVAWTAHWLACYTEWRMSGTWPRIGFVRR